MRSRALFLLLFAALLPGNSAGQDLPTTEQIIANLRYRVPVLRDADLQMQPLTPSPFEGFHAGTIVVDGDRSLSLLVHRETSHVLLLASSTPIDVGLSLAQITALKEEEDRREKMEEIQRHQVLQQFVEGKPSRGPEDALVTIIEFSDFQCPYCARSVEPLDEVMQTYPDQIRLVYLHLPLSFHDWALGAAVAAECAAAQSKGAFWVLHDSYFEHQQDITTVNLNAVGREFLEGSGVDLDAWERCATDTTTSAHRDALAAVYASVALSKELGVTGTPGFFVNGRLLSGVQTADTFIKIVEEITGDGQ